MSAAKRTLLATLILTTALAAVYFGTTGGSPAAPAPAQQDLSVETGGLLLKQPRSIPVSGSGSVHDMLGTGTAGPRIVAYFDPGLSERSTCVGAYQMFTVYIVAENFDFPISALEYFVPEPGDPIFYVVDEVVVGTGSGTIGDMRIDFTTPVDASDQLLIQTVTYETVDGCVSCDNFNGLIPVNPGSAWDAGGEEVQLYVSSYSFPCYTDLVNDMWVASLSSPDSAMLWEDVTGQINATVFNEGHTNPLYVQFFLSPDTIINRADFKLSDRILVDFPGGEVTFFECPLINIPLDAPLGDQYLGVWVDYPDDFVPDNNVEVNPIRIKQDPTIDTTCVYSEDFQEGPAGWMSVDISAGVPQQYWQQSTWAVDTVQYEVAWCGTDDPTYLATPPGYGNFWNQWIEKSFTLTSSNDSLQWSVHYDTEIDWDWVHLEISTDGENYDALESLSGKPLDGGFETRIVALTAYLGQDVTIRIRFISDESYSDEDTNWPSDGGCHIDWIEVPTSTGLQRDDFDTDLDGWEFGNWPGLGGEYRLVYEPTLEPDRDSMINTTTGEEVVTCYSWAAYDPGTLDFPLAPDDWPDSYGYQLAVQSPEIPIQGDAIGYIIEFDVYHDLPLADVIFYMYQTSIDGGPWIRSYYVYYQEIGWSTDQFVIYVGGTGTSLRVRLVGLEVVFYRGQYGISVDPSVGPIFDNVKIYAIGSEQTEVDLSGFPRVCGFSDGDYDGIGDLTDACPGDNPAPFDRDGDGCSDTGAGARHIEYLAQDTLRYYIHESGAPGISDGSDTIAVMAGFDAWMGISGIDIGVEYGGTTAQPDADALDAINTVTFSDPDYVFPAGVLAVGLTTSYIEPTRVGGRFYREGEMIDCDMIFNPLMSFRTDTQGSGTDLQSVATHEAGHLFGLSHSSVQTSTMFYVLRPGTGGRTLKPEDELAFFKAYGDSLNIENSTKLYGIVLHGETSQPIPGAIVFAMDAASGDTMACEYTLLDGIFEFRNLPAANYYVSIYPLNKTSLIGYIGPANINYLINDNAETIFVPEYYDAEESNSDDPSAKTAVTIDPGGEAFVFMSTNIDEAGPSVTVTSPQDEEEDVRIDASVMVSFSEPVNLATLQGNFSLRDTVSGDYIAGNAATLDDDTTLAFIPSETLEFATVYRLEIGTGFSDYFDNGLQDPFVMHFTTEIQPDVAMSSLAPRKGVAGTVVVISGAGFEEDPAGNTVDFNGAEAAITEASVNRLVVTVPGEAVSGNVTVTNLVQEMTSNAITFTVLSGDEVAKGYDAGSVFLGGTPRALSVTPDGQVALIATAAGYSAVVVDPGREDYLEKVDLQVEGGMDGLDVTPGGNFAYAVSVENEILYRINTDMEQGGLAGMSILNEMDIGAEPSGVLIEPSGRRAFIATEEGAVQIWDIDQASATFDMQIGEIPSIGVSLRGRMATDPSGDVLLVPSGSGRLYIYDMTVDSLVADIAAGLDPRDVAVDPTGERAYVTDGEGKVTIVSMSALQKVYDIATGGSLRGGAVTPAGSFLYTVNRELDLCDVIDLRPESGTYRSVASDIPLPANPVDIEFSPDGLYAYSLSEGERLLVVTAIGIGPTLETMNPAAAPAGAVLALTGSELAADSVIAVSFTGAEVEPDMRRDSLLIVTVPPEAESGAVVVIGRNPFRIDAPSNELHLEILGGTSAEAMRLAALLGTGGEPPTGFVSISPCGGFAAVATEAAGADRIRILNIDPASETFHQSIGDLVMDPAVAIGDILITPSGGHGICIDHGAGGGGGGGTLPVISTNRLAEEFCAVTDSIDVSGLAFGISAGCLSPGGYMCAIAEYGDGGSGDCSVHLYLIDPFSGVPGGYLGKVDLGPGHVACAAFHPQALHCYAAVADETGGSIYVVDTDPESPGFLTVAGATALAPAPPQPEPVSISFSPDGGRALLLADEAPALSTRLAMILDTSDPSSPAVVHTQSVGGSTPGAGDIIFSPQGDRVIIAVEGEGLTHYEILTGPDTLVATAQAAGSATDIVSLAYSPDASRFYASAPAGGGIYVYDFSEAGAMAKVSGDGQSEIVGSELQASLRVRATAAGNVGVSGVPVTYSVTSGGGFFTGSEGATQAAVTDRDGYAQVTWALGLDVGTQMVEAAATGLSGSPLTFTAEALVDPATLPLRLVDVLPIDTSAGVSLTTAVRAVFSKPVDIQSAGESTFYIHEDGDMTPVPVLIGSSDGGRQLSMTPRAPLKTSTLYVIELTGGILDLLGGPLENPGTSVFETRDPPPLEISSVTPPSGPRGVPVVVSGTGFSSDPGENTVYFNEVTGGISEAGDDFLDVVIPVSATAGPVSLMVNRGGQVSNELMFRVLVTDSIAIDEDVIKKVGTGSTTRSVAMTPDGVRLYAVSPQANTVTCIDIFYLETLAVIPVGENPYSITIHHEGSHAYVTNFLDHTVSVLDVSPVSGDFNEVIETVPVGINPLDAIGTPDGDRLIVSNMGSLDLSVIDADRSSETFNMVLATVSTGKTTRSMAVTPDGGLLYVCTEDGYLIVDVLDFGVIGSVTTGKTTRTAAVTPDGALLIILTTEGEVLFFDIVPSSPTENEVIGRVTTGGKTRSMAITPDGAFLFLIPEEGDGILVVELSYTTSAGVLVSGDYAGPGTVFATVIDTFYTGEDPADIAFAPNGTGATVVTNAGDNSISVYNPNTGTIAVHLTGFCVDQDGSSALISWTTHLEQGTVGFRLLRSEDGGPYERIGPGLIAARGASRYTFSDERIRPKKSYRYRLEEINELGAGQVFGPVEFTYMAKFTVSQNVPNPFNPETSISFTLPETEDVSLIIYDVAGREIKRLINGRLPADNYTVMWDGRNNRGNSVASGVYFYRIAAGKNVTTKKMVLLR